VTENPLFELYKVTRLFKVKRLRKTEESNINNRKGGHDELLKLLRVGGITRTK
jgi:hypothetical protein